MIRLLAALLLVCSVTTRIEAATSAAGKPAQIAVVRASGNDCEPQCPEWIFVQGEIVAASQSEFRRVIQSLKGRKVPVLLNSVGGNVDAGLAIGQMIRQAGLNTSVAQTNLPVPCAANDNACRTERRKRPPKADFLFQGALCSSACTYALAGGVNRVIHPASFVGVHQITYFQTNRQIYRTYRIQRKRVNGRIVEVSRTLISERVLSQSTRKLENAPQAALESIRKHFLAMGIAPTLNELAVATPAETMRFLNNNERLQLRIATANTNILARLGFDPFSPYFSKGITTAPYTGYSSAGVYEGRNLMIEFSAEPSAANAPKPVAIRFMDRQGPVGAQGMTLELRFPDGSKVDSARSENPEKLTLAIPRGAFCTLPDDAWTVMVISKSNADAKMEPLKLTRRASEMMPIAGIRRVLCPPDRWER